MVDVNTDLNLCFGEIREFSCGHHYLWHSFTSSKLKQLLSSHILYAAVYVMLSTVFSSPADSPLAGLQVQRVRESKTSHLTRDKGDLGNLSRDG